MLFLNAQDGFARRRNGGSGLDKTLDVTDLSIIVPAWNEEEIIGETLSEYVEYFTGRYEFEIVVVIDGCTDGTLGVVKELSGKHPEIRHLHFSKKLGKGGGVIKGFKAARGKYIAFTDADGATPPGELNKLIESVGDRDGAIGSRWMKGAVILKDESFGRKVASRGFNLLVKLLFGLPFRDTQCGAKVFKDHAVRDVIGDIGLTNFTFDVDLLYKMNRKGYKLKEVPINWRHDENSSLNLVRVVPTMFISLVGLRLKTTPLWPYIPKWLIKAVYDEIKND